MRRMAPGIAFLFVALLMIGCGAPRQPLSARVTLDIFSGRADAPTWSLSAAQTRSLTKMLSGLQSVEGMQLQPGGLGYRGFWVDWVGPGANERVRAYAGLVERASLQATHIYADPQRSVERWLLATGRGTLDAQLAQAVEAALQEPTPQAPSGAADLLSGG